MLWLIGIHCRSSGIALVMPGVILAFSIPVMMKMPHRRSMNTGAIINHARWRGAHFFEANPTASSSTPPASGARWCRHVSVLGSAAGGRTLVARSAA
jgi:hypothetical protein